MRDPDATEVVSAPPSNDELILGRYRLLEHLGSGGTADVWRARDERRDRLAILKILRERGDPAARARFLDEARRLDALAHPGIVPVEGIHDAFGVTLIEFEHVEGTTLADVRRTKGPLRPREVALLLLRLASVLDALHDLGLAHLDLKPSNVLLAEDGSVRLIDFGIAEHLGERPPVVRGTRGYVAPEVEAGGAVTRASDVYGLALIARELLGDQRDIPRTSALLRRALDPDPRRRPSRARSFATTFAFTTLLETELASVRRGLAPIGAFVLSFDLASDALALMTLAARRARQELRRIPLDGRARRAAPYGVTCVVVAALFTAVTALSNASATTARAAPSDPPMREAGFALPPLSAYRATLEAQAPAPTAAAGALIEWTVALRNTGSAGWYRGVRGAQASLATAVGASVAVQTTDYVGPGQVGWFVTRFRAPSTPGTYTVTLKPRIDGAGPLGDLTIRSAVTVTPAR